VGSRPASVSDANHQLLPAPATLAACGVVGLAAVLLLPEMASVLPWGDRPEPNEVQLAGTSLGVLLLTAGYLCVATRVTGLGASWGLLAFGYNAALVVVKFVLSPASYYHSPRTALSEHLWVGISVMLLYAGALGAIFAMVRRYQGSRPWPWPAKLGLVAALVVFAMACRYVVALVLGRTASDYLRHVFAGAGIWLPALIASASFLAVETFDRAAHASASRGPEASLRATFAVGLALIGVYHGLWVVFMMRLF
jgi:hypothetical protein